MKKIFLDRGIFSVFLAIFILALSTPAWSATSVEDDLAIDLNELESLDDDLFDDEPLVEEEEEPVALESYNRFVFSVNDKLYFYALKPVAKGWRVVPVPVRRSLNNFFTNLSAPLRAGNSLLQWRWKSAATEGARFLLNTTVGLLGLFDPAKAWFDLDKQTADFGQTMARYGMPDGAYLVLPVLGPSSVRDGIGEVVDILLDPTQIWVDRRTDRALLFVADQVNFVSLDRDTYERVTEGALDPYLAIKNLYQQKRAAEIKEAL